MKFKEYMTEGRSVQDIQSMFIKTVSKRNAKIEIIKGNNTPLAIKVSLPSISKDTAFVAELTNFSEIAV